MTNKIRHNMKFSFRALLALSITLLALQGVKADSAKDASSKSSGDVSIEGVVTARAVLDETNAIFFLQDASGGIGVKYSGEMDKLPKTGYQIKLSAGATDKSFVSFKSSELVSTNASLPKLTIVRDIKDAAKVAEAKGKYGVVPGTKFSAGTFKGGVTTKLDAGGTPVDILISHRLDGREIPTAAFNFFGVIASNDIIGGDGNGTVLVPNRIVPTTASKTRKFATANTCFTCHLVDKKLVGPAYLSVADKYKNDKDAIAKMVDQIENGGMGKWGPIPMIGFKGRLQQTQMEELANWIYDMRWQVLLND